MDIALTKFASIFGIPPSVFSGSMYILSYSDTYTAYCPRGLIKSKNIASKRLVVNFRSSLMGIKLAMKFLYSLRNLTLQSLASVIYPGITII